MTGLNEGDIEGAIAKGFGELHIYRDNAIQCFNNFEFSKHYR
jgi:hypothetical protein